MLLNSESPSKPHKYPTVVRFDEDELPELRNWNVGSKYKLTLEVEQMSMSKGDEYGEMEDSKEKPKTRASFKVLSVSPLGGRNTDDPKRPATLSNALKKRV